MLFYYLYRTRLGAVAIVPDRAGRFHLIFQEEDLGSYSSAVAAADDASGGHTFTPSSGIDLGDLGIPEDLGEWERIPLRR